MKLEMNAHASGKEKCGPALVKKLSAMNDLDEWHSPRRPSVVRG